VNPPDDANDECPDNPSRAPTDFRRRESDVLVDAGGHDVPNEARLGSHDATNIAGSVSEAGLLMAQLTADIGDGIVTVALPLYVYELMGSASATSAAFLVEVLIGIGV
jgi:hypothetical protein